jgi:hypothetical protein
MSSFCRCPEPAMNERRPDFCRRCGVRHNPRIVSSDRTMAEFFARLADLPGVNPAAMLEARDRELAGRDTFGLKYLARDNVAEGCEEAADGLIYAALEWLKDRRTGEEDMDPALLDAAHHFALAHAALKRHKWSA